MAEDDEINFLLSNVNDYDQPKKSRPKSVKKVSFSAEKESVTTLDDGEPTLKSSSTSSGLLCDALSDNFSKSAEQSPTVSTNYTKLSCTSRE